MAESVLRLARHDHRRWHLEHPAKHHRRTRARAAPQLNGAGPVNFDLSDDQLLLQSSVHDYFQTRLPLSRIRTLIDCGTDDDEIWRGLMDLGIGAVVAPECYGGLGLGVLDIAA